MTRPDFATRFEALLGDGRLSAILSRLGSAPTVLLAGDPGAGKSAVAARVADRLGRPASGTGAVVRAAASAAGLALDEYNRRLALRPDEDLALDARAAEAIACGVASAFESRLAGHLGAWLRGRGRAGLTSILLRCEPREQACRLLAREASPRLRDAVGPLLAGADPCSLEDCVRALRAARSPAVGEALLVLESQVARTAADRARMRARYSVDLDDPSAYDAVLDTSRIGVEACADRVLLAAGVTAVVLPAPAAAGGRNDPRGLPGCRG